MATGAEGRILYAAPLLRQTSDIIEALQFPAPFMKCQLIISHIARAGGRAGEGGRSAACCCTRELPNPKDSCQSRRGGVAVVVTGH